MTIQPHFWTDNLTTGQPRLCGQLPASMPQTITRPIETPSIDVSKWPQHLSHSAMEHHGDASRQWFDPLRIDLSIETPSHSFQSTTWSGTLGSEAQAFQYLGSPGGDLDPVVTAPSSFDFVTHSPSKSIFLSSPKEEVPPAYPQEKVDHIDNSPEASNIFARRSVTARPLPGTNMSTLSRWAQGTYNVSDRTSFGELANPGAPPLGQKKRRVAPSVAGSSTSVTCGCGKVFASKSVRE
jgi:hypothetical protein